MASAIVALVPLSAAEALSQHAILATHLHGPVSGLDAAERAEHFTRLAGFETGRNDSVALEAIDQALAHEPAAFRHRIRAGILDRLGRHEDALAAREASLAMAPGDVDAILDVAYAYRKAGRNREAAALFAAAVRRDPSRLGAVEDHAYTLKDAGERDAAAAAFRTVIANAPRYPQATPAERLALEEKLWNARREIALLTRGWYATGYMTWRGGAGFASPVPDASDGASGAGLETGWMLPVEGELGTGPLTAYARAFGGFARDTLVWRDSSVQAGIGLRWAPVTDSRLTLSAERLVAIGDAARDDWLFSVTWSDGEGFGLDPFRREWLTWNVYASAAYATGEGDDTAFTLVQSEALAGWSRRLGRDLVVIPHVVAEWRHLAETTGRTTRFDVGPGVILRWWFNEATDSAPRSYVTLKIQYRFAVAGDTADDGALLADLSFYL